MWTVKVENNETIKFHIEIDPLKNEVLIDSISRMTTSPQMYSRTSFPISQFTMDKLAEVLAIEYKKVVEKQRLIKTIGEMMQDFRYISVENG